MPRAAKPKLIGAFTLTREGSTYVLRVEDETGKAVLFQATCDQALLLADTLDDLLAAEEAELHPAPPPRQHTAPDGLDRLGTVKWFNVAKGFGFITPDEGGEDLFVHRSVLEQSGIADLPDGARVRIRVEVGRKGPTVATIQRV